MARRDGSYECCCEYAYICVGCQQEIHKANKEEYAKKMQRWTVEAIKEIAKQLGASLPPLPQPPEDY